MALCVTCCLQGISCWYSMIGMIRLMIFYTCFHWQITVESLASPAQINIWVIILLRMSGSVKICVMPTLIALHSSCIIPAAGATWKTIFSTPLKHGLTMAFTTSFVNSLMVSITLNIISDWPVIHVCFHFRRSNWIWCLHHQELELCKIWYKFKLAFSHDLKAFVILCRVARPIMDVALQ